MAFYDYTMHKQSPGHCDGKGAHIPLLAFIGAILVLHVIIPLVIMTIMDCMRRNGVLRLLSEYHYLLMILWVVYIICSNLIESVTLRTCNLLFWPYQLTSGIFLVVSYFFVFIESFCGDEMKYLSNVMETPIAEAYLEELKQAKPQKLMRIRFNDEKLQKNCICCCDSGENDHSIREPDEVPQVVKDQRQRFFEYTCSEDLTAPQNISNHPIIRLTLSKLVGFGNAETMNAYDRQRNEMVADAKESYQNSQQCEPIIFECEDIIRNFKPKICVFTKGFCLSPCWLHKAVYVLAILLGFSWPYRILFKLMTNASHITVYKTLRICNIQDGKCETCSHEEIDTGRSSPSAYDKLHKLQSRQKQQGHTSSPHVSVKQSESPFKVNISDIGPKLMSGTPQSLHTENEQSNRTAEPEEISESERQPLLSNRRANTYS